MALQLPGKSPMLGKGAREWLAERTDEAVTWEKITGLLAAKPPASLLICTPDLKVWSESAANDPSPVAQPATSSLTKREAEVLAWLREGKTGPEVAIILNCAQRTVESHVAKIYRKLGVRHRTQLILQSKPPASS
jgi:DNA-binding CsgD family transcriptional regulator